MCLIILSPTGDLPPRDHFIQAAHDNPDGIGVMSALGVQKFMGRKKARRAWHYVSDLRMPFAVHFRWRTHGAVTADLCHPFRAADGTMVMHNGVIGATATRAAREGDNVSDTSVFVRDYMPEVPEPGSYGFESYLRLLELAIGASKLVLMHPRAYDFTIVNPDRGHWDGGLWYSNFDSKPGARKWWQEYDYALTDSYEIGAQAAQTSLTPSERIHSAVVHKFNGSPTQSVSTALAKLSDGPSRLAQTEEELQTSCALCCDELFIAEYDVGICADCRDLGRKAEAGDLEARALLEERATFAEEIRAEREERREAYKSGLLGVG